MILAFMLYCFAGSVLLAVVGLGLAEVARLLRWPSRWSWMAALALLLALAATAPFRPDAPTALETVSLPEPTLSATGDPAPAAGDRSVSLDPRAAFAQLLRSAVPLADGGVGAALIGGWVALSVLLIGVGLAAQRRSARRRRRWPTAWIAGERVRVAPQEGPAVAGLVRPEIVVPRWLAAASASERRMAVLHEREHLRAGDPYVLALGYLALAAMPWNPVVWWLHRRLRLAIELDCDHRVLRRGVSARAYGSFLIDAAALRGRLPGAITLASSSGILERRLMAMIESLPKHVAARAVGFTALCALLLVAACETRLPTSSEIDEMDAVAAEGHLTRLHVRSAGDSISYLVDGVEVTAAEAHAIAADQIARIDVRGAADGDQVWIHTLREIREDTTAARLEALHAAEITGEAVGRVQLRPIREGTAGTVSSAQSFHGLLVIDGEVVSVTRLDDTLSELGPDRIERIEVLKGPAATREYSQPEAANGVIRITTKK